MVTLEGRKKENIRHRKEDSRREREKEVCYILRGRVAQQEKGIQVTKKVIKRVKKRLEEKQNMIRGGKKE